MYRLTLFISFLVLLLTTQAQITISQADVEAHLALGNTIISYSDTLGGTVDIGTTGQSSWSFSGHQNQLELDATVINNDDSPAAATFSNATHTTYSNPTFAGVTSETWVHLSLGNGMYSDLGTYTTVDLGPVTSATTIDIDPAEVILQLPLNYQDSWTSSGTRSVSVEVAGFPQSYDVDFVVTRTVDAHGSLTMPDGTVEEALRIKIESEITTNVTGTPQTETSLGYMFISRSGSAVSVNVAGAPKSVSGSIEVDNVTWNYGNNATTDVEQIEELVNDFSLAQNYPNPFNPTTNIQYSIPQTSNVSLKVYDVLGNEVATIVDRELSAGVYNSEFNASNLSSGIYFYTIQTGNLTATKKLMLVK